jgi:hypothetical protein
LVLIQGIKPELNPQEIQVLDWISSLYGSRLEPKENDVFLVLIQGKKPELNFQEIQVLDWISSLYGSRIRHKG